MLRAGVPEAAIHKHRYPPFQKDKIWFAEYRLIPSPTGNAMLAKESGQRQLRLLVATSLIETSALGTRVRIRNHWCIWKRHSRR